MRFMLMRRADQKTEAGILPTPEFFAAMAAYNQEMARAGVLLSGEGLKASAKEAKVKFANGPHEHERANGVRYAGFWHDDHGDGSFGPGRHRNPPDFAVRASDGDTTTIARQP